MNTLFLAKSDNVLFKHFSEEMLDIEQTVNNENQTASKGNNFNTFIKIPTHK